MKCRECENFLEIQMGWYRMWLCPTTKNSIYEPDFEFECPEYVKKKGKENHGKKNNTSR